MKTTSYSLFIFSMAGKATLFLAAVLPLLPLPIQAECKQWDISGEWQLKQSNGIPISWVKVDEQDEKKVVEQGKGERQVTVRSGKTYVYILTDSGQTLATVTVKSQ